MFNWLLGYEAKRKRQLKKAPEGPIKTFLSAPFPDAEKRIDQVDVLSVDFETTGLNAQRDKLLSVGFVTLSQGQIDLSTSYHNIINCSGFLNEKNVSIHHITDSQRQEGLPLKQVIDDLLKALQGKIMLVHFATIEQKFLAQACIELYGYAPSFPIIDTLSLEKKLLDKRSVAYDPSELRLPNLRQKYQLPSHNGHNALNDAIATAELLLAQVHQRKRHRLPRVKNLLR